jgi:hypothetical protein
MYECAATTTTAPATPWRGRQHRLGELLTELQTFLSAGSEVTKCVGELAKSVLGPEPLFRRNRS